MQRTARLAGGAVVDIRRVGEPDAAEEACVLTLRDADGSVVLERTGFGARMLPPAGADLDADGVPEAIFSIDSGGGNRCCWNMLVVSLSARPRVRVEVPQPLGWQLDERGSRWVAEETMAFYDLGPDMASSPIAVRLHRLTSAGLVDVTREYCGQLLDTNATGPFSREDEFRLLTPERRRASVTSQGDAFANEQTRLAAVGIALQLHTCGRPGDADSLLNEVVPGADAPTLRRRVAEAINAPGVRDRR